MLTEKETADQESTLAPPKQKNTAWKKILRTVVFLAGLAFLVSGLSFLLERKSAKARLTQFFEEETSYDVMYFGTSHVLNGFLPQELWEEYGITSYNFGGNGMNLPATYWLIQNVLDYTVPDIILIDCSKLSSNTMSNTTIQQGHSIWDAFPLTKNKWLAIKDIFEPEEQLEFLWKLSIYHNRWGELTADDFNVAYSVNHGSIAYFTVATPGKFVPIPDSSKSSADTNGVLYLRKAIELCQSRGIEVILTYLPFPASATKQKEANLAADIAQEYAIPYLNFLKMDGIVNFNTDLKDADHLNFSGACKITSYLGTYFMDNYGLTGHKGEEAFQQWDENHSQYAETTKARFNWQKDLAGNLLQLSNQKYSCAIHIRKDSALWQDERILALIGNIPAQGDLDKLSIAAAQQEEYFLFSDNQNKTFLECVGSESAPDMESFLTPVHYEAQADGGHILSIGEMKYLLGNDASDTDIQIAIIDNASGKLIKTMSFNVTVTSQKLTATRAGFLENINTASSTGGQN